MSMSHWSVNGYGVNLEGNIFDLKKVIDLLNMEEDGDTELEGIKDPFNGFLGDISNCDIIDEVLLLDKFEKHFKYLCFVDTGTNQLGAYLLYSPSYPWSMTDEEKLLTRKDIEEMMIDVLEYVTILNKEDIIKRLEHVNLGGQG